MLHIMSIRNDYSRNPSSEVDEIAHRVLDAARTAVLRHQGRRVTLAEVAREAGVSRPTVYRRWPDMDTLLRDLMTREVGRIVAAVTETTPLHTGPRFDATIDQVVRIAAAMRDDELFAVLWTARSDFMTPYVFDRLGESQRGLLRLLADGISDGQRDGHIRAGDPDKLAAMVLLITQSAVQSRPLVEPILGDDWTIELHHALSAYLKPENS
ncbi:putative TetR family transcriptional regulator [Gordonia effusa NBRC 100432]|uniref:Putative TetR family transcriptional regulator n=2 Tax=Gordonia effusa TaxID=263908 RepID=H0QWQ7_9ACTN|nr:putative TetR family transcriptional regulator [Gordonia effusa NBRC 100432]